MTSAQFSADRPVVLTNCTARKKVGMPAVSASQLPPTSSPAELALAWALHSRSVAPSTPVAALYRGRSFADAVTSAAHAGGDLHVVSAGFGLVPLGTNLPNYSLTISAGEGSIAAQLSAWNATTADWWQALCSALGQPAPIARVVAAAGAAPVLVALPSTYLAMIEPELRSLPRSHQQRLRIFTGGTGSRSLATELRAYVMPYGDGLQAIAGYAGTRGDFAQRALRHFVQALGGHHLPLDEARALVSDAMSRNPQPAAIMRTRASDDEILSLLQSSWASHAGSASRLLRHLRDDKHIACEQRRFQDLWRSARQSLAVKAAS